MFKNHFLIALRKLVRDKAYTLINISGLAIGLSSIILITLYIRPLKKYVHPALLWVWDLITGDAILKEVPRINGQR
jgi:hypothetical protein